MASDSGPRIRRSAGIRGDPRNPAPEHHAVSTTPKAPPEAKQAERVSTSPYAKPKVLMGEVVAPIQKFTAPGGGVEIARNRDAFRAFMIARHLRPTEWARVAGIPPGEIMAFLTGRARTVAPQSLEKLARAANCSVQDFFQ